MRTYLRCFLLCLLGMVASLFVFGQDSFDIIRGGLYLHFLWGGWSRFIFDAFCLLCLLSAILAMLRCVPVIGQFLKWGTWLVLSGAYHVFYRVMYRFPDSQDLRNLFVTDRGIAAETIGALLSPSSLLLGLAPVIAVVLSYIIICKIFCRPRRARLAECLLVYAAGAVIIGMYCYHPIYPTTFSADAFASSLRIIDMYRKEAGYYEISRSDYAAETPQTAPSDNVVLIIDESIRGDYLSINNPLLDTTPVLEDYLRSCPRNMWNYGVAVSGTTFTFTSHTAILSGMSRFPDRKLASLRHPTIFQVAKGNNYKTVLVNLPKQFPNLTFNQRDLRYVDEAHLGWSSFASDIKMADFSAARYIHELLTKEKGLFIVMVKWGLHTHYEARYPDGEEYARYLPRLRDGERFTLDKRREIVNSYKNALRFNTDGFFKALFGDTESPVKSLTDTTIIWLSDHGQSFQEDGQLSTHGGRAMEQALIPFVVFSTTPWVLNNIRRPEDVPGTLSQLNVYPTLRSILERRTDCREGDFLSLFWKGRWKNPPLFHTHSLWSGAVPVPVKDGRAVLRKERYMY